MDQLILQLKRNSRTHRLTNYKWIMQCINIYTHDPYIRCLGVHISAGTSACVRHAIRPSVIMTHFAGNYLFILKNLFWISKDFGLLIHTDAIYCEIAVQQGVNMVNMSLNGGSFFVLSPRFGKHMWSTLCWSDKCESLHMYTDDTNLIW